MRHKAKRKQADVSLKLIYKPIPGAGRYRRHKEVSYHSPYENKQIILGHVHEYFPQYLNDTSTVTDAEGKLIMRINDDWWRIYSYFQSAAAAMEQTRKKQSIEKTTAIKPKRMKTEEHSSMLEFVEYRDDDLKTQTIQAFITLPGGRKVLVAEINRQYDSRVRKMMCRTYDMDGKEDLPPTSNLKVAKKQVERQENHYIQKVARREEAKWRGVDEIEAIAEEMGRIEEEDMRLGREFSKTPEYKKLMRQAKLKQAHGIPNSKMKRRDELKNLRRLDENEKGIER